MVPVEIELQILAMRGSGLSQEKLARAVGCSKRLVVEILRLGHTRDRKAVKPKIPRVGRKGRCGECGGMVWLPCRACLLRADLASGTENRLDPALVDVID